MRSGKPDCDRVHRARGSELDLILKHPTGQRHEVSRKKQAEHMSEPEPNANQQKNLLPFGRLHMSQTLIGSAESWALSMIGITSPPDQWVRTFFLRLRASSI